MSRNNAPQIDIVKLEDKEDKLKAFITEQILQIRNRSGDTSVLLIARSAASPVAKAVQALLGDGQLGHRVQAIFAIADSVEGESPAIGESALHWRRLARDARLLDAHEQLVIGLTTCWVGDCMRRDPNKRDAYECFAADAAIPANWARTSFERLWEASGRRSGSPAAGMDCALDACLSATALEQSCEETASSHQD